MWIFDTADGLSRYLQLDYHVPLAVSSFHGHRRSHILHNVPGRDRDIAMFSHGLCMPVAASLTSYTGGVGESTSWPNPRNAT